MGKIIVAIDGHAGCGKSTTAKLVAEELGYLYIDSGAMYRGVTLHCLRNHIDITPEKAFHNELSAIRLHFEVDEITGKSDLYLNGENVAEEIRSVEVTDRVSDVSAIPEIREFLVTEQRKIAENKGVVMDGRDIGTVVFKNAELKVFMTANIESRAKRRKKEMDEKGQPVLLEDIIANLEKRDHLDSTRNVSPLRKAEDAVVIDTSDITIEQQVKKVLELAKAKMH